MSRVKLVKHTTQTHTCNNCTIKANHKYWHQMVTEPAFFLLVRFGCLCVRLCMDFVYATEREKTFLPIFVTHFWMNLFHFFARRGEHFFVRCLLSLCVSLFLFLHLYHCLARYTSSSYYISLSLSLSLFTPLPIFTKILSFFLNKGSRIIFHYCLKIILKA